jgi:hypothetical protein
METNAPKRGQAVYPVQITVVCANAQYLVQGCIIASPTCSKRMQPNVIAGMDTQAIAGMNITKSRPAFK